MLTRRSGFCRDTGDGGHQRTGPDRRAISQSAGAVHRSGGARRADRRDGAHGLDGPQRQIRPARGDRQSRGRRRQHRRRAGREVAGRRLHAADRLDRLRRQSEPVPRSRLRSVQGLPADHRARLVAQRHPGPSLLAHHLDQAADRQGQGGQGEAQHHQSGPGLDAASDGGAAAAQGRHPGREHPLQRRGTGHPGAARQDHAGRHHRPAAGPSAHQVGRPARARHHRREALVRPARRADDGGAGLSRLRLRDLPGHVRAGGNARRRSCSAWRATRSRCWPIRRRWRSCAASASTCGRAARRAWPSGSRARCRCGATSSCSRASNCSRVVRRSLRGRSCGGVTWQR